MNYYTSSTNIIVQPQKYFYSNELLANSSLNTSFTELANEDDLKTDLQKNDEFFDIYNSALNYILLLDTRSLGYDFNYIITSSAQRLGFEYVNKAYADNLYSQVISNMNYSESYASLINAEIMMHETYVNYINNVLSNNNGVTITPQGQALLSIISGNLNTLLNY